MSSTIMNLAQDALDMATQAPATVLRLAKLLLTQPTTFVTEAGAALDSIPALLIFTAHAAATFSSLAPGEAKKGGKPTSWLKTLIVGYLVCNGGVDLSTWLIGGKPDTFYGWEYATIMLVMWYAATFTPVVSMLLDFSVLGFPVLGIFSAAMVELYCAQGIRDIAQGAVATFGATSWVPVLVLPVLNNFGGVFLRELFDKSQTSQEADKPSMDLYFYLSHSALFSALALWTNTLSVPATFGVVALSMCLRSGLAKLDRNVDWTPYAASLSHTVSQVPDVTGLPSFLPAPVLELLSLPGKLIQKLK